MTPTIAAPAALRAIVAASAALLIGACATDQGPTHDLVLVGGRVVDPESGLDAVRNVGITDGSIVSVSEEPLRGAELLDVSGLVVAPGFIDLHAHGQDPFSSALQARDGVTTALELESGVFPVGSWYGAKEGRAVTHFGASVSHSGARLHLMHDGFEAGHQATNPPDAAVVGARPEGFYRAATPDELEGLEERIAGGLAEGALGIGFGINYTPGAEPAEIIALFRTAAERGVPAFVHTRDFGLPAVDEVLAAAEETGASLHIVHIGSSANREVPEALAKIRAARERGVDVSTEVYPYTAASTRLESAIFDEGFRDKLGIGYGDLEWAATGERLTEATFREYRERGGWVIIHFMDDAVVEGAVAAPDVIIASDGVPFVEGRGHPRGAGTFSRVLGHYVRERGSLNLVTALGKMTILPAKRLESWAPAMAAKGRIRVGADADITVFDPERVVDQATFADPVRPSAGIVHVLVAGTLVVRDEAPVPDVFPGTGVRAGG